MVRLQTDLFPMCHFFISITLLGSGPEWSKDKALLLTMVIQFKKVNENSNIKEKKKMLWAALEIIPFVHFFHLDKHLDGVRGTMNKIH